MEEKDFFQTLSEPLKIWVFEPDDLAFFTVGFLAGIFVPGLFTKLTIWGLTGLVTWRFIKAKKKYPKGFYGHAQYYYGIAKWELYPLSLQKEFSE